MTFFDRQIKIVATIILAGIGVYAYNKYDLKSYIMVDAKTVKPLGKINFSFNDSYRDTWNKSTTYPYKALMRHGYDLRLMSELPKSKEPLNRRIYLEKETDSTIKYVLNSNRGKKAEGTLNIAIGIENLTKQLLDSKKAEILRLLEEQQHIDSSSPDYDYEMCLMSELPINGQPLRGHVYFEHTQTPGTLKCVVLSSEGKKMIGEIKHHLGDSVLLPEDPILREQFKNRFKNSGANFDIEGGRFPITRNNLEHAKYELLKETANKGLTAYKNWITINTSMLRPNKFIINNGEITIPYAEQIHIKYYGQRGKEFRSLRIDLINRRGTPLEEVIPQLKELIQSIDAAGWKRSPGYEHVIGKLDDKLMVIRLFDIPTPRNVDFMRWTKGEYILAVDGNAKIAPYPKEKKPYRLVVITRLEISKDLNFK